MPFGFLAYWLTYTVLQLPQLPIQTVQPCFMLAGIRQPVAVPTEKEPVITTQHGHTPLTARTPEPGPLLPHSDTASSPA